MNNSNKLLILTLSLLFFNNVMSQDTLKTKRNSSFFDFSISLGKSGWSSYMGSTSGPEYARKFKDYGLSFRFGTKWSLKEIGNAYNIALQCNWIRIKGAYGYGTGEYLGAGWGKDTIDVIQFDAPILNIGIVNQFKIGQGTLQLNFNTGPTVFFYANIGAGWVVNPEIKLGYKKIYLGWDYSLISILHKKDSHFGIYRSYSCISIGKNF